MPTFNQSARYEDPEVVGRYTRWDGLREAEKYIFDTYFKTGSRILDIGCGTGRTTRALFQLGHNVIGIDYSNAMVKSCRNSSSDVSFLRMDGCRLAFPDETFDISFFPYNGIDTIVPLQGRLNALREMKRVTRTGGLVVYSSRNIVHRVLNRFRTKTFLEALRSNLSELKVQLLKNRLLFFQGYILQETDLEGHLQVYTPTLKKTIAQFRKLPGNADLLEVVGLSPGDPLTSISRNCHMIYYVWKKSG